MIKGLAFDQGGVLTIGGEKGTNEKAASRAMGLRQVIEVPDLLEALKRGRINNLQFVQQVNRRYPNAPKKLTNKVWGQIYKTLTPEPLAYDFAHRCRQAGLQVGLLSNINPAVAELLRANGAYEGFNPLALSCYVGCAKPDPEIYAWFEAQLPGIKPQEILLLDDQQKCVDGALRRGWQALLVTSPQQMVRDASKLLGIR